MKTVPTFSRPDRSGRLRWRARGRRRPDGRTHLDGGFINPIRASYRALRTFLRVISRPVRRDRGLEGVVIQPYRGYGSSEELYLVGRVFRQPRFGAGLREGSVGREVADVLRRFTRWGLGGVRVVARATGVERTFETDRDGYFQVQLPRPAEERGDDARDGRGDGAHAPRAARRDASSGDRWRAVELEVVVDGDTAVDKGLVYVPPPSARLVVISDIDDTVMHTGVANKAKMLWRLFVQGPDSRVAFPGVAELYRKLHEGVGGDEGNPMLYVSRAPWSIYEILEAFFRLKEIPEGPILFLREWGLTLQRPLPRRAQDHKRDLIEDMLRRYSKLPFLLIGDSGQHDPEIYAEIVREHPDRVRAVYIRDVDADPDRRDQVLGLALELEKAGSALILAKDSEAMAEHARSIGLIA